MQPPSAEEFAEAPRTVIDDAWAFDGVERGPDPDPDPGSTEVSADPAADSAAPADPIHDRGMIAHGLPIYVALEPVDMRLGSRACRRDAARAHRRRCGRAVQGAPVAPAPPPRSPAS